jgi:CRP-like cAMP-binding protein
MLTTVQVIGARQDIVREGDRLATSHLLLDGWAYRYVSLADGRRQIVAIHIPGDFVDLHSFPLQVMDHAVATFTPVRVILAPHDRLRALTEAFPHLTRLFWLSTLIDAAIHRQWLLGLGQRTALEQAAHRLCELYVRLEIAGLAEDGGFDMPMSQASFADSLGLSPVHTNRVVRDLRDQGLVGWRGRRVDLLDWPALCELAEFDPVYLNLISVPR